MDPTKSDAQPIWTAFQGLSGHPGTLVVWWRTDAVTQADTMSMELFTSPTAKDAARLAVMKIRVLEADTTVTRIVAATVYSEHRRAGKVNGS